MVLTSEGTLREERPPSARPTAESGHRIRVLDSYRALAIAMVLFYHYTYQFTLLQVPDAPIPARPFLGTFPPFQYGWLGVEFFFVISGFVILMTLERCRSVADFAVRRFARLWPPLFVAATLTTIVVALIGPAYWQVSWRDFLTSIFFIDPNDLPKFLHHPGVKFVDGAYWSLWVEVRFYVLAAVVYLFARRNFIAYWLVFQAFTAILVLFQPVQQPLAQSLLKLAFFPFYVPYFTIGVCLYEIYSKGALRNLAIAGALFAACIVLASAALQLGVFQKSSVTICIAGNLVIFLMFYLFISESRLIDAFRFRPLVILGQASYSLYLIHLSIGVSLIRLGMRLGVPYPVALTAAICMVVGLALLLFRYGEIPAKTFIVKHSPPLVFWVERHVPWLNYGLRGPESDARWRR